MNNLEIITLKEKNITDFAESRNRLLRNAKADWVLFVDSDEVLSKELQKEISNFKYQKPNFTGYYIKRRIIFLGKEIGEDKVLRLGKKKAGKWKRAVHETWNIKSKPGTLRGYIIHNTAGNLHDYIAKINKYSDMHARENLKEGKKSNLFKIIFYPIAKFLQNIILGRGFVFSMLQSFHSFLGWTKQWQLQKN